MEPVERTQEQQERLSVLLAGLLERASDPLSVDQIVEHFGRRAFGGALFVFALVNLLPTPPGSGTVLGLPLLFIAPQLALGARKPWLPRNVRERTLSPALLSSACRRAIPWLERVDVLSTRRLTFMFERPGETLIGLACTVLAGVIVLPIPLGNVLPATAILILSLSLILRDGLLTILGYVIAGASVGALIVSWKLMSAAAAHLGAWLGGG